MFEAPRQREFPLPPLTVDQVGQQLRSGGEEARLSPVLDAARDPVAALQGAAGLQLLRLLPGLRLPHRRQVVDPGDDAAGGRRDRQLQADHRRDVLPRQQRQQRPRHRRVLLRARRLRRQHDRGGDRHRRAVHLRQRAPAAAVEDRTDSRTGSPIRAGTSASTSCRTSGRGRSPPSTIATSTSTWDRARRSIRSTTSTPTTSTTRTSASSAARRSRPVPPGSKAARSPRP